MPSPSTERKRCNVKDPIVIDPPNFDAKAIWDDCKVAMDHVQNADGSTNWRAAFYADPGICSCPSCHETYWCLGSRQRCAVCGFEYPTNAWSMYSWGVQAAWLKEGPEKSKLDKGYYEASEYFRYGFHNPPPKGTDLFKLFEETDWKPLMQKFLHMERYAKDRTLGPPDPPTVQRGYA